MDIEDLEKIIRILRDNSVTEFELEQDGTHIKLSRAELAQAGLPHTVVPVAQFQPAIPVSAAAQQQAASSSESSYEGFERVESPIVGTFYRKPSPDADPFAREGDIVKKGDTICIIEAMKIMNEIESPVDGKVEKILLSDGQVCEYGELLFVINPRV
ncbi:MAG: acetyl-CoA carboxylase biotin carboxyl carrier protein [Bdellovibrionales bacterium]|nr:acetyl-CoA carboxylase biotin carboxyl carrier protein [Bdellovibrionales bacterium]